ncbi:MAG: cyclic nucleotide-binding domain-containing protein [Polyangiaceae bacterium]|nr:cyclic nucleotide-binding domain-containing protein [Polyangiaceae bacterium]
MSDVAQRRVERSLFLRTLFGGRRSGATLERVAALMRDVAFEVDQVIYRQGEASQQIFFVVKGQVALEAPGLTPWTFGPGDGFGFQDAMQDAPHARTARAATPVHALAFSVEDWFDVLEGHPELGRGALMDHAGSVAQMIDELGLGAAFPPAVEAPAAAELGRPAGLVERMLMLSEAALLSRAGIQALAVLAQRSRPLALVAGAQVASEGAARSRRLWFVGRGGLALRRGTEVGHVGPGSLVGSLAILARERLDADLVAATDALVLELSEDDVLDVMDDHFDLARAVFSYMARERARLMELRARARAKSA